MRVEANPVLRVNGSGVSVLGDLRDVKRGGGAKPCK